jgi:hypothetical protein
MYIRLSMVPPLKPPLKPRQKLKKSKLSLPKQIQSPAIASGFFVFRLLINAKRKR